LTASPLPGPAGNVEYFLWLRRGAPPLDEADLRRAVAGGAGGEGGAGRARGGRRRRARGRAGGAPCAGRGGGAGGVAWSPSRPMPLAVPTGRPEAVTSARLVAGRLTAAGILVRVLKTEADDLRCPDTEPMPASAAAAEGAEMVLVIGGDGTLLRAA